MCIHTIVKKRKKEMIIIKSLGMDYYTKVSLDDHRKNSIGIIVRHACAPAAAAVTVPDFSDLNWATFVKWQIGLTHLNDFFVLKRNGTII